jgi:Uma2 family endonuclease
MSWREEGRSETKILNRSGERTQPCGTPLSDPDLAVEVNSPIFNEYERPERKFLSQVVEFGPRPYLMSF